MFKKFLKKVKRSAKKIPSVPDVKQIQSNLTIKKLRKKLTWRFIFRWAIALAIAGLVCGALLFAWYFKDLPRPGELRNRNAEESTILYDRNGKQIYDISGDERRILLKSSEIPDVIKEATIAIEDKNFYHHYGFDFKGLARAALGLGTQGGGSTITQQYIKNAILSPQFSLTRKIKELILAIELEAIYSKDDILTLYLNEIPYGSNIYGVEAASQAYFGKSAKDGLTLSEAATLAAIPQAPTRYSPYGNNLNLLMARKNKVLDDMVKTNAITSEEADKAKTEAPLVAKDFAQKRDNFPAPHFVMYIREQLVKKYGEEMVQRGGLRVTTTLDLDLQEKADDAVKNQGAKTLPRVKASNASLVAIDPRSGHLLAMVGSLDYFNRDNEGNFNVATAQRQPGSSIKPLVYATLFKDKYSPGSVFWDVPTDFNGYKPNNFDGRFRGPLTLRSALGSSLNIPAVKALSLAGVNDFIETATDLGITTYGDKKGAGLALALGAGETKLVDLTAAYSVFANNGDKHPLTSIIKIQDSRGKVLDEWKDSSKQVLKPEIAYEVSEMLADVNAKRATFGSAVNLLSVSGHAVASKTGTTNDFKDALTVGYTPSISVGVWAGNNNGDEMEHGGGSTAAAPIWHDFMLKVLSGKPNEPFSRPNTISEITVDMLSGKKPTPASGQLIKDLFAPWQLPTKDDDVHQVIKVCKSNGLLATDATPAEEIEEKVFTKVHSERPDNPAWEIPVQSWAKASNLVSDPPTEKCDIAFTNPKVDITSPTENATVSGIFTATADVIFPPNNDYGTVEFSVDGKSVSKDTAEPFTATIDASSLSSGSHTILVTATGSNGAQGTDSITISVSKDTTAPGDVTNVTLLPGAKNATVSWTNPSDSDLSSVTFYVSQSSGVKGSKVGTVNANQSTTQTTVLNNLVSGITNYVTIITTDKSGNESSSTKQYPVTPL
ncbi:MAG TPA: PBP1A family penicillin-binding protein [Patescibacteria group bacterium]